jgi:hypothetical protein
MSNKAAGIIVILVVLLIVLSGGLSDMVSVSVDTDNADGVPDSGVSWSDNIGCNATQVWSGNGYDVVSGDCE